MEWFIYNRSAAYDYVRASMLGKDDEDNGTEPCSSNLGEADTTVEECLNFGKPEKSKASCSSSSIHGASEPKDRVRHANSSSSEKHAKLSEGSGKRTSLAGDRAAADPGSPLTPHTGNESASRADNSKVKVRSVLM